MTRTYEMLWDCAFCGTKKLLGKTHRYCPSCGAAQDPARRYFPSAADKVEVKDHVYVGADRICPACSAPHSAVVKHCTGCGAPLDGAARAKSLTDPPSPPPKRRVATKGQSNLKRDALTLTLFFGGLIGFFLLIAWSEDVRVRVSAHAWKHEIRIEAFGPVSDSSWCDQMPSDAYDVSRKSEVRSHEQVPDGQECSTVTRDNADGTFSESQSCRTTYRSEPVYDSRCYYTVDRWHHVRSVTTEGSRPDEARPWPAVRLARTGQCKGCEREGEHVESYVVQLTQVQPEDGEEPFTKECAYDEGKWATLAPSSEWYIDVGMMTGFIDCDTLRAEP